MPRVSLSVVCWLSTTVAVVSGSARAEDVVAPLSPALAAIPESYRRGFSSVRQRELRAWVEFLASPELEGREPGTAGYRTASRYVATELQAYGFSGGGDDGTYFQNFDMVRYTLEGEKSRLSVQAAGTPAVDIPLDGEISADTFAKVHWSGPWIFAGYGEAGDIDGVDTFHGIREALGGKLESATAIVFKPRHEHVPLGLLARHYGVRRLLVIDGGHKGRIRRRQAVRPRYRYEEMFDNDGLDVVYASKTVVEALLRQAGRDLATLEKMAAPPTFVLEGVEVELKLEQTEHSYRTRNVVGVLEGADPEFRNEYITAGAHLDHVGRRGDDIFFGADDDGSGCATLLALARAYAENGRRPRRSLLLLFYSVEEIGLHGSRYYVDHPTVPLENIVINFNLDMVGRNEEKKDDRPEDNVDTMHLVGSRRHSLELEPWIRRLNDGRGIGLKFEMDEDDNVYRRSDHYNFAEKGIPVTFFFGGFHPDYHKTTDTPDKINYEKLVKISRLLFALTFELGNRPERLVNNRL